ncbi:hypothetical protein LIV57_06865 [Chryseobacterium sp. X308]|uniref:hypothetical protein n=1 Tax=Chryseobacterium sp. X308 TaxID=2884873 RepID=UPI001D1553F4|nr:hypothetical protein [Chryseobacterium sp. X308]MCC3214989.1 hypothetical protein [Chryseobacterium sp. X308]
MTKETFEKAKKIDNNIKVLNERKDLLKKVHNQLLINDIDKDDAHKLLTDYMELINFSIDKESKEFNEL